MTVAATLEETEFVLCDLWPGVPDPRAGVPTDGFTGSDHHDVTTAAYPLGMKIQVYDTTSSGLSVFIYLAQIAPTGSNIVGPRHIVGWDDEALSYGVTTEAGTDVLDDMGPAAIALSLMDTNQTSYGWYWCDGVCPVTFVPALDGLYAADTTVVKGCSMMRNNSTVADATYGEFCFSLVTAVGEPIIGMSLADDT